MNMIVIRSTGGIDKSKSWEQITSDQSFVLDLNPKQEKLLSIFGYYEIADKKRCGLSTCHAPHIKGYLVTTESGVKTNIGHQCGTNHFNIDFQQLVNDFHKFMEFEVAKETILKTKSEYSETKDKIDKILNGQRGAKWANKKLSQTFDKSKVGESAAKILSDLRRSSSGELYIQGKASEAEVEMQLKNNPKMHRDDAKFIDRSVGIVQYVDVIVERDKLKNLLITDSLEVLNAVFQCDIGNTSTPDLKSLAKKANQIQKNISESETFVLRAKKFLAHENLKPIRLKLEKDKQYSIKDSEHFITFLESIYKD
ncbi:hypothetical protein [Oceanisphaera sp. KMM 10153]|uniref:hypothetical protein n=1 Tax=Oceanisphaera submarina TaxID=3390193 RepID=UPI003976E38C